MKNSRFLNLKIVLLMILIAFLFQPIIPVGATEFSQTAYIADKTIPATVLVYSILEYSARVSTSHGTLEQKNTKSTAIWRLWAPASL